MAINFDAANRAHDLLLQVRQTLAQVGDAHVGRFTAWRTDGARRESLGEAVGQVDEAVELLRTYGAPEARGERFGIAALSHVRASIEELRTGEARVARAVARRMEPRDTDILRHKPRTLDDQLAHAELATIETPARAAWAERDTRSTEQWIAYGDALHETAANILRRRDSELGRADLAALDRIALRSNGASLYVDYPSDPLHGPLQLRNAPDVSAELVDVRRWAGQDVAVGNGGDVFTVRRARLLLDDARQVVDAVPGTVPAPIATLRDDTRAMIERNAERISGRRHDAFHRTPDYAEIGRIRENLALLRLAGTKHPQADDLLTW
ncbi:MAG: hypothetical protein JWL76_1216 [Thermoleophilia bacterium]|nr:hypothetical protein [Thermoleophilia bacterium]